MPCTTILVGKSASYDGSTMIARNDDSPAGKFMPKKFAVIEPKDQPQTYQSVISHVSVELPENPMRYTSMPNAVEGEGIWAAAGVNACNIAMTATETITSNERVLGADPLVTGGLGEEDLVIVTLPYIHSAREGVQRLGALLTQYGTYESNGIAFSDTDEIWWLETIGGHHWMARRVPDHSYVVMPNQLGIDALDLDDAFGEQKENMCSSDLREFIASHHLDLSMNAQKDENNLPCGILDTRAAFGSHSDADHCYNTPRAWYGQRYFNPRSNRWDGPDAEFTPESNDIPWARIPEKKITPEDVKYVLSSYYQGTDYNPYAKYGNETLRGAYRAIGVNRTDFMALLQLRPYVPAEIGAVEWICYASNAFNSMAPFYTNISRTPAYLANTTGEVTTENFYWTSRLVAALADANYGKNLFHIERYQESVASKGHALIEKYDRAFIDQKPEDAQELCESANDEIAKMLKKEATDVLNHVLMDASNGMKNQYSRSDH